jgi:hypothetical protein
MGTGLGSCQNIGSGEIGEITEPDFQTEIAVVIRWRKYSIFRRDNDYLEFSDRRMGRGRKGAGGKMRGPG